MMNCYKSSDAWNATLLYDFHDDDHHFWSRSNLTVPLSPCFSSSSFTSPPPNSSCLVCHVKKMVFAICRNLAKGVKLTMEAGSDWVNLTATDCPEPPSDGDGDGDGDDGASNFLAIIIPILLLLLLLLGVLLCVFRKRLLKFLRAKLGSQRPETEESEQSVALENGTS